MNKIGIVCIDAVPTVGIQLRVNEIKPFVDKTVLFTQHWTITPRNYWGIPVVAGMDNLKAWLENEADSGSVLINYRQRIKDFDPGKYPEPVKGVWHELRADGSTAYAMDNFKGASTVLSKSFTILAEDFVGKELKQAEEAEEKPAYPTEELPVLTVVFLTHNRTAVACHCLEALCQKLKYEKEIRFCICDDRSEEGHIEALERVLRNNGVFDYSIQRTTAERWGLGASMNNGLKDAFSISPVVLTAEDDFLLQHDFDITQYVAVILSGDEFGMRLAHVATSKGRHGSVTGVVEYKYREFWRVIGGTTPSINEHYIFNNQVMLRHKRAYDALGFYLECVKPEQMEIDMCRKYCLAYSDGRAPTGAVLYPKKYLLDTTDNGLFLHIGASTLNHGWHVPSKFKALNDPERDRIMRKQNERPRLFHIVTPYFNDPNELKRCLRSVAGQSIDRDKFIMTVVDDASEKTLSDEARKECEKYNFVRFIRNEIRSNTGGAKNTGIKAGIGSEYTVFLDSDDTFADNNVLASLESFIMNENRPDVILCAFIFEHTGGTRRYTATTPEAMARENCIAPWTKVVKTNKVGFFEPNRRIASDVCHFLRLVDTVETVACTSFPVIRYRKDNKQSAWGNSTENFSQDVMVARFQLMEDILKERFVHRYAAKRALQQLRWEYENSLKEIIQHTSESYFIKEG